MENLESVGSQLKRERESRGLSLQEVQEATKITLHNLSALEEDRFDYFPNRVYTRAFLRDYANFLGLNSASLLASYEQTYTVKSDPGDTSPVRRKSRLKAVFGVVTTVVVLGAIAAAAYVYVTGHGLNIAAMKPSTRPTVGQPSGTATLPKAPVVPPPPAATPPSSGLSTTTPIPVVPPAQTKPKFMTLQITATHVVWMQVVADGKSQMLTMKPGEVKTWQAAKLIHIRAGKAGAVKLLWNGVAQPPIGSLGAPGNRDFTFDKAPAPPASPAPAQPGPSGGPR